MLLPIGWIVFLLECAIAAFSGFIFWRFWSQATISRSVRLKAIALYAFGCIIILGLTLLLPL